MKNAGISGAGIDPTILEQRPNLLGPVVRKVDSAIQRIVIFSDELSKIVYLLI